MTIAVEHSLSNVYDSTVNERKGKFNRYDYGVVLLLALLVFGGIGGAFQPIRLFSFIFSPWIYIRLFSGRTNNQQKWVFVFFMFWFLYAIVSFLWTPDRVEGLKQIMYYYVHFSLFFLLVFWAGKAANPIRAIFAGWILILMLTIPIALYEILSYQHLPISRHGSDRLINLGGDIIKQRFASVTFYNSNTYVVILVFCLPFLYGKLIQIKKLWKKGLLWILLLLSSIILIFNASRGGVLCLCVISIVFFMFMFKEKRFHTQNIVLLCFVALVTTSILVSYSDVIFRYFSYRVDEGGSLLEDNARLYLYGIALTLFLNSLFLGTGVGSEQNAMASLSTGITANHNLFLEVLMQYGVVVFFFFCIFLYRIFSKLSTVKDNAVKFVLFSFLLIFIPLFIINSGYLLMPAVWLLFASLFVIGTKTRILKN